MDSLVTFPKPTSPLTNVTSPVLPDTLSTVFTSAFSAILSNLVFKVLVKLLSVWDATEKSIVPSASW